MEYELKRALVNFLHCGELIERQREGEVIDESLQQTGLGEDSRHLIAEEKNALVFPNNEVEIGRVPSAGQLESQHLVLAMDVNAEQGVVGNESCR